MFPELFSLGSFTLYSYGLFLAVAYLLAIYLSVWRTEKIGLEKKVMMDLSIVLLIAAILGAKLFYVFVNLPAMIADPSLLLGVARAGGVFQGGLIVATIAGVVYLLVKKQPLWSFADIIAPAIAIGQAIGRVGCFGSGCCHGNPSDSPWAVTFPSNNVGGAPYTFSVHPVQLYETILMIFAFALLMWLWNRRQFEGQIFWVYVISYSLIRGGVTEWFRGDHDAVLLGLKTQQWIAVFTLVVGMAAYWFLQRRAEQQK